MKYLMVAALVAAGCGSSKPAGGGGDGGTAMQTCMPDGNSVSLSGRYAVKGDLVVNVKVVAGCTGSACIVDNDADAELLFLADMTQSGSTVSATVTPCKIVVPQVALKNQPMPVQLTVPDALVQSIVPVMNTSTLGGTQTCASFDAQPISIAVGASLAMPTTDPLPNYTSGANPPVVLCGNAAATACASTANPVGPTDKGCVCDQEGDTKLGATVLAKNAPGFDDIDKLYVDLRTAVTLSGQVYPGNKIRGTINALKLEQNVLGCHRTNAPGARDCNDSETGTVAGFNPSVTQSVNAKSTFAAVPVAAGTSCSDVKAMEGTLFP